MSLVFTEERIIAILKIGQMTSYHCVDFYSKISDFVRFELQKMYFVMSLGKSRERERESCWKKKVGEYYLFS